MNIYEAQTTPSNTTMGSVSEGNEVGSLGLSSDQLHGLLNMLNSQKISTSEKMNGKRVSWIIDTGASNHMTGTLNLLHDLRDIVPCTVRLPNRNNIVVTKEGSLTLDGGICL